ncbi:uncharacterized protein LOC110905491 [Helianthus annuus]|uniref:uncharacterized protein LOC110905491 n=1 Tax=Helianthus annuus TaxID=4232 RepID=UPI000B904144|nr:uncharacterized protein LOC110905491 [Helianthus annuus]
MADKLIESETQIKDGALNLDPGMDALTVVFGKDKGGFLKGVGYGVTFSKYWQGPQTKGSSKERIAQLEFQLHNERLECGKKKMKKLRPCRCRWQKQITHLINF